MQRSILLTLLLIFGFAGLSFADKVVKVYYGNGKLSSVQIYYDAGGTKGPNKYYWPNGRLREKIWYRHGLAYIIHTWSTTGKRMQ